MFLQIFILGCLSAVLAQEPFQCPTDPDNPPGCLAGNYPNIYDCTQFYQCDVACASHLMTCPPGLHFNVDTGTCDWPWSANCRPVTPTTIPPPTTPAPPEETTPAPITTTPSPLPAAATAFTAYLESDRYILLNPVYFDGVEPNLHNHFEDLNLFRVPADGLYWFSMSAAALQGIGLDFVLGLNQIREISLKRWATDHTGPDTTSRDYMVQLDMNNIIQTQSLTEGLYSDFELQTSLCGFSLTEMVGAANLVAFFAAKEVNHVGAQSPFRFDVNDVNEGNHFDGTSTFVVPSDGLYFFHISAGHGAGLQLELDLLYNDIPLVGLYRNSTTHNGLDATSRSIMMELRAGDRMYLANSAGSSLYSDNDYVTAFSGFRYSLPQGGEVAWSVGRTTSWTGDSTAQYPVVYDYVVVNVGPLLPWNVAENRVDIPTSGYYFLHLNTGTMPGYGVNYSLTKNLAIFIDILRSSTHQNGNDVISRSAISHFVQGDLLQMGAGQGTGMYSTEKLETGFTGFLIYAT